MIEMLPLSVKPTLQKKEKKPRRTRTIYSRDQLEVLNEYFSQKSRYIVHPER